MGLLGLTSDPQTPPQTQPTGAQNFLEFLRIGTQTYLQAKAIEADYEMQGLTAPQLGVSRATAVTTVEETRPLDIVKTAVIIGGIILAGVVIVRMIRK